MIQQFHDFTLTPRPPQKRQIELHSVGPDCYLLPFVYTVYIPYIYIYIYIFIFLFFFLCLPFFKCDMDLLGLK